MKRVLLCGNSLLISGLGASLGIAPGLDLRQVEPLAERIREQIEAWQPDVVILEARLLSSGLPLALLQDFPHLKLIGVDIEENRLLVLSGLIAEIPTTGELLEMISQGSVEDRGEEDTGDGLKTARRGRKTQH